MSLKKCVIKNTWYLTCGFLFFSIALNFIMVQIAKSIENIISMLESFHYDVFMKTISYIFVLCLIYILCNFTYYFLYQCVDKKSRKLSVEYCYSNYLKKELHYFTKVGIGDISYSITSLAPEIGSYYAAFWQMLLVNAVTLIILFITIASYNLFFAVLIILGISLLILFTSFLSNKISEGTSVEETLDSEINNTIVQSFQGISIIKMLKREPYFLNSYRAELSEKKYKNDIIKNTWYSLYVVFYDVMVIILPIIVLLVGFLLRQKDIISIGAVIAIYSLVGLLQEPIRNIADSVTYYKEHVNRVKKLGKLTEAPEKEKLIPEIHSIELQVEHLEFNGITLLRDINFKVEEGDIISLKGPSGCGKSTLLKMMLGLLDNSGFQCYYDGILQNEVEEAVLFENIALVEQTPFLFSASILENILLGEEFDPELLREIIQVCVLDQMIERYGLEKKVDWAGSNISGGEMQRVTIARILIRKPRFLFLDEITASLDEDTSRRIAQNIVNYAKKYNMTIVAVSHKNEFTELSNKIVGLHN